MNGRYYVTISEEINRWDPEFLLMLGAPEDEYEPEIKEIVKGLSTLKNEQELALLIKETFERFFLGEYDLDYCLKIATKIWKKL